jgi:hypothetical protein
MHAAGIAGLAGLSNYMIARGQFFFDRLNMQKPPDFSIAYDFRAEETQEVHAHEARSFSRESKPAISVVCIKRAYMRA